MARSRGMVVRQWALVEALKAGRRGLTVGQLRERIGVSRATIYRDLDILVAAGVPIAAERINGEVRHRLIRDDPGAPLRPEESAALRLSRRLLAPLEGTRLVESLDRLLGRLSRGRMAWAPAGVVSVGDDASARCPGTVRAVDLAIRRGHRLAFDYPAAGGGRERRQVDPVALRLHKAQLYLVAFDLHRDDWRIFKVVRIEGEIDLEGAADPHPDYDEDALFAHTAGIWTGDPVDVTIRLGPAVAARAAEWPLVAGQVAELQGDGSVLIRARVAGIMEALRWTLSWGGAAEALAPDELRAAVREELATALGWYTGGAE